MLEDYCLGVQTNVSQETLDFLVEVPESVFNDFARQGEGAGSYFGISSSGLKVELCLSSVCEGVTSYIVSNENPLRSSAFVFVRLGVAPYAMRDGGDDFEHNKFCVETLIEGGPDVVYNSCKLIHPVGHVYLNMVSE